MKKLALLFVATVIVTVATSQVVTIKVTQTQPFVRYEQTTAKAVLANPEWNGYIEPSSCEYVIDLNNKTLDFIYEGTSSKDRYETISVNGDNVHITLKDNARAGIKSFDLQFDYNIKMQTSSITWYDKESNFTRTQKFIKPVVTIIK
jgi:hypothetical protein